MSTVKKIRYGFKRLLSEFSQKEDYWHLRESFLPEARRKKQEYYLDMYGKGFYPGEMDKGIPVYYVDGKHRSFFTITVLNYGLGLLARQARGELVEKELGQVLHYLQTTQGEDGAWRSSFPEGVRHEMANGTVSGMTQGLAISFLVRCVYAGLLEEGVCLEMIGRARNLMLSPLCVSYPYGVAFIEEFSVPGNSILNGSLFALFGLYDYERFVSETRGRDAEQAEKFSEKRMLEQVGPETEDLNFLVLEENIRKILPCFEFGSWSRYNLKNSLCSRFYHQLHIDMLKAMYELTEKDIYLRYAGKWEKGLRFSVFYILLKAVQKLWQVNRWSMNADKRQ